MNFLFYPILSRVKIIERRWTGWKRSEKSGEFHVLFLFQFSQLLTFLSWKTCLQLTLQLINNEPIILCRRTWMTTTSSHRNRMRVKHRRICQSLQCRHHSHRPPIPSLTRHRTWTKEDKELTHQVNDSKKLFCHENHQPLRNCKLIFDRCFLAGSN